MKKETFILTHIEGLFFRCSRHTWGSSCTRLGLVEAMLLKAVPPRKGKDSVQIAVALQMIN